MNSATEVRQGVTGASWLNMLLGIWVASSPFVLGFSHNTILMCSNIATGAAITFLSFAGRTGTGFTDGLIIFVCIWLFTSGFVLGHVLLWNNILLAALIIIVAVINEGWHPARILPERTEKSAG